MEQKILIFKFLITFSLIFYSSVCFSNKIIEGKAKIIDGDTIHIGKNKIRLYGIDAPEINQTCTINKIIWGCGFDSSQALESMNCIPIYYCCLTFNRFSKSYRTIENSEKNYEFKNPNFLCHQPAFYKHSLHEICL